MPGPHEKLAHAYEKDHLVTITETDGTVYKKCLVEDVVYVQTTRFEVWRFEVHFLEGETALFGPDLKSVEILG